MLVQEIAYTTEWLGDYKPFTKELLEECLTDLLQRAECCPYDNPPEPTQLCKGVYQDNYYMERNGVQYVIQHDIVCDNLTLYEVVND